MIDLERRFRLLLLAFPRSYRQRRGEEMVGTLMEAARPGQRWPSLGDAADLVGAGLQVRTGLAAQSPVGSVVGLAAPYGLAIAGGLATVCLLFGELQVPGVWRQGWQPNQFTGQRFETNAVPFYGLTLLAFVGMAVARAGLARVVALAACVAGYVSYTTGGLRGNGKPPVDLLAFVFVALVPTVVAPAVRRSLVGVLGVAVAVIALGALLAPSRTGPDSRAAFYADTPSTVIHDRPYLAVGLLVVVVALVARAKRTNQWQLGGAAALLVPPVAALLVERPIPGAYGDHYVLVVAFLEVVGLVLAGLVVQLNKVLVVSRRPD